MNNLFNFDYEVQTLQNKDAEQTASRFSVVYGQDGKIVHTKKDSYQIVPTADFSMIGNHFQDKGYEVRPFTHKAGEVIGLTIDIKNNAPTKVGDKNYQAVITLPNNGGGTGYLSIHEVRLICTNGLTRTKMLNKSYSVKIPHNLTYQSALGLMQKSLDSFIELIKQIEAFDLKLDAQKIDKYEAKRLLNTWFWECEFPTSQKGDMTLDTFRELLATAPNEIKCIDRYHKLMAAYDKEIGYNADLGLDLSIYTVYATVTNYLSRKVENSQSTAPDEIQFQRAESKVEFFNMFA